MGERYRAQYETFLTEDEEVTEFFIVDTKTGLRSDTVEVSAEYLQLRARQGIRINITEENRELVIDYAEVLNRAEEITPLLDFHAPSQRHNHLVVDSGDA